ncbi:MAG: hypothetical protein EOO03_15915 [Chitinophagaceae bacterium]|nr:MAG: hypothetical protein EOO03_15915 [Chitinophagaceae bacterium]
MMSKSFRFLLAAVFVLLLQTAPSFAQIKIGDLPINIDELFQTSKVLKVKKGFSPKFLLGNVQLNKVGLLGENLKGVELLGNVFSKKNIEQVTKLYKTYKTGLVVYKVLAAAGGAAAVYSTVRGVTDSQKFDDATVKGVLYPALGSLATGILTKVITKKASYKAVDIFNGIARKKIQDIFSIQPASSNLGVGVYVKL